MGVDELFWMGLDGMAMEGLILGFGFGSLYHPLQFYPPFACHTLAAPARFAPSSFFVLGPQH